MYVPCYSNCVQNIEDPRRASCGSSKVQKCPVNFSWKISRCFSWKILYLFCSRLPCGDRYQKRKVTFYSKLRFEKSAIYLFWIKYVSMNPLLHIFFFNTFCQHFERLNLRTPQHSRHSALIHQYIIDIFSHFIRHFIQCHRHETRQKFLLIYNLQKP